MNSNGIDIEIKENEIDRKRGFFCVGGKVIEKCMGNPREGLTFACSVGLCDRLAD